MSDSYLIAIFKVTGRPSTQLPKRIPVGDPLSYLQKFVHDVRASKANFRGGFLPIDDSGTEPNGTIAVTAANVDAGDTITFTLWDYAVTLTAGTDFAVDTSDDSAQAVLITTALTNHPFLGTVFDFSESSGTITCQGNFPGDLLENVVISTSDATAFGITAIGTAQAGVDGDAEYFFQGRRHARVV